MNSTNSTNATSWSPPLPSPSTSIGGAPNGHNISTTLTCLFAPTLAERRKCRNECTINTCPMALSYWSYRPNIPINAVFLIISVILGGLLLIQAYRFRGFKMYTTVVYIGLAMQSIGYGARIYANSHPFNDVSFIMQLSCLTLSPVFFAAGIYFSLTRIIATIGENISLITPKKIPRIFIACDVVCLFLQAAGGAVSAWRAMQDLMPDPGNYTLISGLSLQSLTLLVFLGLSLDFGRRAKKEVKKYGSGALNQDISARRLRRSKRFTGLLVSLSVCAVLIFARSCYRIAELAEGWKGYLMRTERYVICFESIPIALAGLLLAGFHPAFCFRHSIQSPLPPPPRASFERTERVVTIRYEKPKGSPYEYNHTRARPVFDQVPPPPKPSRKSREISWTSEAQTQSAESFE